MPTYRVTDNNSGITLDLTGDSPPTEEELTKIFSQYQPKGNEKPVQSPEQNPVIGGINKAKQIADAINPLGNPMAYPGTAEAALHAASGMIAKPVSDVMGLAATAKDVITGNQEGNPEG